MGNSRYSEAQEQGQQPWQCGDGHWVTGSRCEPQGKRRAGQGHGLKKPAAQMTASSFLRKYPRSILGTFW